MTTNIENHLIELFNKTNETLIRISSILMFLDFSEFVNEQDAVTKHAIISIIRLYIFRLVKGLKNYEKLKAYLNENQSEAFELGFFKDEKNNISILPKRTFNHYLKTKFTSQQIQELQSIAQMIIKESQKRKILLDENIVEDTLKKESVKKSVKVTDQLIREKTKLIKKFFGPHLDFNLKCNSLYKQSEILDVLFRATQSRYCYVNGALEKLKIVDKDNSKPTEKTIMNHLHKLQKTNNPGTEIEEYFQKIVKSMFNYLRSNYNLPARKFDISYDLTDVHYYGKKDMKFSCGGKHDHSTSTFHKYLICKVDLIDVEFFIDVIPVFAWNTTMLEKLLDRSLERVKKMIPVGLIKMDRQFSNDSEIHRVLQKHKVDYLMIGKGGNSLDKLFDQCEVETTKIFKNVLAPGSKKNPVYINVAIVENKDKIKLDEGDKIRDQIMFIFSNPNTTINDVYKFGRWYRRRWNIENGIKQLKHSSIRIRTTSTNYFIRAFDFMLSCSFYNLWLFENILITLAVDGKLIHKVYVTIEVFMYLLTEEEDWYVPPG